MNLFSVCFCVCVCVFVWRNQLSIPYSDCLGQEAAWISHLSGFLNNCIDLMREASSSSLRQGGQQTLV